MQVVEDVERLNLEQDPENEERFRQWSEHSHEDYLSYYRRYYGSRHEIVKLFNLPLPWHCPEMIDTPENKMERKTVLESVSNFALGHEIESKFFSELAG